MANEARDVPLSSAWFSKPSTGNIAFTPALTKYKGSLSEAEVTRLVDAAEMVHVILPGGRGIAPGFDE